LFDAMRLPRSSLLDRLTGPDAPSVVLVEAPAGYGKSWLLRRAAGEGATRVRGVVPSIEPGSTVVIDDAHLLDSEAVERLVEQIEDADVPTRLFIAGRLLPDDVMDAAALVDALVIDTHAMTLTTADIEGELGSTSEAAPQVVEAAAGCVRIVATALEQIRRMAEDDPVALVARLVRATTTEALQRLAARDAAVVGLLARAPGLHRSLLDRLAGTGFVDRAVAAGVPLRRQLAGGVELAMAAAFRTVPLERSMAEHLASELVERGWAVEAINLLLDAGDHHRATQLVMDLSESITETVESQTLLGLLRRLGPVTEREPLLLLRRAAATRAIGRLDAARRDIDRAVELAEAGDPKVRRRVSVEAARARLVDGDRDAAARGAKQALVDLGANEERTYARAYEVLAECGTTSDARHDLQRAAECYHVAAAAWEDCGEAARARACRRDLALGALVPLGRFDEALAQLGQLLATTELSDAERSMTTLFEGFVLYNANRLESADSRFVRATDIGYVRENPRLIAAAAWGRALVASRRDDLATTLRWIASAENTALSSDDDMHGVPFLCDMTNVLGALGELDLAERYFVRAAARRSVYPDQVATTGFMLNARRGLLGDVEAVLKGTPPIDWWRVKLLAAYASARTGQLEVARHLFADSQHELIALGFSDADAMGEGRVVRELQNMLERAASPEPAPPPRRQTAPAAADASRVRLCVIGEPMTVHVGDEARTIPSGNPQRLVGVVVAHGGSTTFDQLGESIWPDEDVETSRTRLRNVLLRLRRAVGDVVARSASGIRLAPGVACDLLEFERLASDALASARADPDLAGRLAHDAIEAGDGTVFIDFEYDEWAVSSRRAAEQQLIGMFDLLSVQAEDAGDLPLAQSYAERALRLDRYTDSRYVRLAELLTLQDRVAAAVAVLDDASEVAREMGGALPSAARHRRQELVRGTAAGN
jgi:DNA-binding SARP family transcriptional activator